MGFQKINKENTFLVGLMVLVILLCCSNQAQAAQSGDFTYTVTAGKAQITRYTGAGGVVIIPSRLGGYPVTSIGSPGFNSCKGLTSITIPQGITSIGYCAFVGCTGLTSITIPLSVTSIGDAAFQGCTGLTSISIPRGVTSINEGVFKNCSGLTSITIPQWVTSIDKDAFNGCSGLTSVIVPQGVTSIGKMAFGKDLISIRFNSATTTIIDFAIPLSIKIIGYDPSTAKTYATLNGNKFEAIGSTQPIGQDYTYTVTDGEATITKCTGAGGIVAIPSIIDGYPMTSIGDNAFYYFAELTSVAIPQGVTNIGEKSFANCRGLTRITIPEGVTIIGGYAFWDCKGLAGITIPKSMISIENGAFNECIRLTSITFNSAITKIYDSAHTIPATTKIIGYDPSTAKDYSVKYGRTFETISSTVNNDITGMTEMITASSTVEPDKVWTIKLSGLVKESSITDKIYVTNSQGFEQATTCTVTTANGVSQIQVKPDTNYASGDYTLWVRDIESVSGTQLKTQVYMKFTVSTSLS